MLLLPMPQYALKMNRKKVILESYRRKFAVWIIFYITLYIYKIKIIIAFELITSQTSFYNFLMVFLN